ncbi:hypothetical protein TD95_003281 [Thielaviopsis punctulata]|uniref:Hyaluronan/mRNA-binding protein domain-containing protein n=1 Tax=Thielaviopsis punctulata TaxID=72032 RepID=A0A0F4ZDR3_9PEZI|nr:hypothetical protein TD95_003281 [Thielaviopsis punctulata]
MYPKQESRLTRTHKDNSDLTNGSQRLPKYFGKAAYTNTDPNKTTKKNGNGKANWGEIGDDLLDDDEFNFTHARRRSNSSSFSHNVRSFTTKFDVNDDPVFEEDMHGPSEDEADAEPLAKVDTSESASNASTEL